ncbi:sirohydrochlorin cobaltochelatase [uncultured Bacteroides sp.]|uniref:sirohydrochlorin cobaltochelatase n=1 Tax=uncultured Bacteroides sp. TaxID=162156 RepID=UPI002AA90FB1|nr:sirohydrochlorin cobaltochelatase [uncultured Bacteroides sp.]
MTRTILFCITLLLGTLSYAHEGDNFMESDMMTTMKPGDKAALLMVHFGTTYDNTRALTIDAINQKMAAAFPALTVREAWTSRIVMRRMKVRGEIKLTPTEALNQLHKEGYTHVVVQSTNIIEGIEMESLRTEVAGAEHLFKDIRIGNPLLYTVSDYRKVAAILAQYKPREGAAVLVGHGTYTPSTSSYTMIDYMLKSEGYKNFYVGTIEGYPSFDDMLEQLKHNGEKQVTLIPFMFVAGNHANNDIAVGWKQALEKVGLQVSVRMQGLGEIPEIQQLFMEHVRYMLTHKMINIMDKKKRYAAEKD